MQVVPIVRIAVAARVMVSLVLLSVAFSGAGGPCCAAHGLGPSSASVRGGEFTFAAGYHNSGAEWEHIDSSEVYDIARNVIYFKASYGLLDGWEAYLTAGFADALIEDALRGVVGDVDFEGDYKPVFGLGVRGSIYRTSALDIGPVFQYNFYSSYDGQLDTGLTDHLPGPILVGAEVTDAYDMTVGIGFHHSTSFAELYGGALAYWAKASVSMTLSELGMRQAEFKERGSAGGFLGIVLPLVSGFSLDVEADYRSDLSAGISLGRTFGGM